MSKKHEARPQVPAGYPDADRIRLQPLLAALEKLKEMAASHREIDSDSLTAKTLQFSALQFRAALWEGAKVKEEKTPEQLGTLLGVSADTVRYWCRQDHVRYRQTKSGRYYVDVQSALEYYAHN